MSKIRIVNWLLTRRCNLNCSYCAITKNYKNKPSEYPNMKHYHRNEMSTEYVIKGLKKFKLHNPDCFHIMYGGEPLLRSDLPDIINYCNKENIHYTIITNNSDEIQPLIENLLLKVDYISGLTSSVDPIIFNKNASKTDIVKKSTSGIEKLSQYKDIIGDRVAEITISKSNIQYIYPLVKELTEHGISSSITFIDITKSPYYDFSNVINKKELVEPSAQLADQFEKIFNDKLDVHMGKQLVKKIWDILPSELNCDIHKNLHNLTIDADGSVRLCLRIRGISTPTLKLEDIFTENLIINPYLNFYVLKDKKLYCRKCNWTCVLMSKLIDTENINKEELIHSERRT